jgi:hypothetical protein
VGPPLGAELLARVGRIADAAAAEVTSQPGVKPCNAGLAVRAMHPGALATEMYLGHCSGDYRALWRAARPKARAAREGDSGPAPPEEGDVGQLQHRPVGLDFLGWRPFERENLRFLGLEKLGFLGFARQNLAFSRGYTGFLLENNFSHLYTTAAALRRALTLSKC